jgi:hypothetical protein
VRRCTVTDRLPALVATFSDAAPAAPAVVAVSTTAPPTTPPRNLSPAVAPEKLSTLEDLVRGFLLSKRSPKTREAYAVDLTGWLTWCHGLQVDALAAGIHHAHTYLRRRRRLPGLRAKRSFQDEFGVPAGSLAGPADAVVGDRGACP